MVDNILETRVVDNILETRVNDRRSEDRVFKRGGGHSWRYRKLEMPVFDGSDPDGWILRGETYFNFYRLSEEERVEEAVLALEGDAIQWYRWENHRHTITKLADFKKRILQEFQSANEGSLHEQWMSLTQTTTVKEYRRKYIQLTGPLEDVTKNVMMGRFMSELKEEVKVELRVLNPYNLDQAMDMAVRIEEKLRVGSPKKGMGINPGGPCKGSLTLNSQRSGSVGLVSTFGVPNTNPTSQRSWPKAPTESQASASSPRSVSTVSGGVVVETEVHGG